MACWLVPKHSRPQREWDAGVLRDFPSGRRYLIAVSGGRDSVTLLHWLLSNGYRKLIVCHLDHKLRGRSGAADARFVERLAADLRVPFVGGTADVRSLALREKHSLETAARAARFQFFARVARRRRCSTIFLGHHADDLVETFLFNLFRGAGAQGQRSIRVVTTQQIDRVELQLVRPLLGVWREEIDEYVAAHRLRFREDATNQSRGPARNRLRHGIIPLLGKQFGREVRKSLWRAAAIATEEDALVDGMLPDELRGADKLPVRGLRELPLALQRRAIRGWLMSHDVAEVGFDHVEDVRSMLEVAAGAAKINLPRGRHARRRSGELFIECGRGLSAPTAPRHFQKSGH